MSMTFCHNLGFSKDGKCGSPENKVQTIENGNSMMKSFETVPGNVLRFSESPERGVRMLIARQHLLPGLDSCCSLTAHVVS